MSEEYPKITVAALIADGEAELKTGPFGTQLKASEYTVDGIPVINVRNIGWGGIRPEKLEFISPATRDRLASHVLRSGDIVFGRKGAVERHAFIRSAQEGWFQGSDCLRLRLNSPRIDRQFASYYLLTAGHQSWMMNQCSHGATMASLNQEIVERIEIPAPPLRIQQRIAGVLATYDALIDNNVRRIAILEQMARALYREWLVDFRFRGHDGVPPGPSVHRSVPAGWRTVKLDDIAESVRTNVAKGDLNTQHPYVGLEHIPRGSLALDAWEMTTELGSNKLAFKKGDVLFTKIRPYFHKVSVAPFAGLCSADTFVIRPRRPEHYALVVATVSSDDFVAHATATSNGSKMPRANWDVLRDYRVVVPSGDHAALFSRFFTDVLAQQQTLIFQIHNLRKTRDLLLPRLLSGDIPLPEVEPAV